MGVMRLIFFMLMMAAGIVTSQAAASPNISVAFVLDESGSISSEDFQLENRGFIRALERLPTNGAIELSVIGFSRNVEVIVDSTILTSATYGDVKRALEGNRQSRGGTNMASAISTAATMLGNSVAATRIICLATDGEPSVYSFPPDSRARREAVTAAEAAKAAGIALAPVGIGLASSGKNFLDLIASDPPVPNPGNFEEFATVVTNDCVGAVQSALNVQLTPDLVLFGIQNPETADVCVDSQRIQLRNNSNRPAFVKAIRLVDSGESLDKDQFSIIRLNGVKFSDVTTRVKLSPLATLDIDVLLKPTLSPADGSYDAILEVVAEDEGGRVSTAMTTLYARYVPGLTKSLCSKVIDASPTIQRISDLGEPLTGTDRPLTEKDVADAIDTDGELGRAGLVTDGNARLLLVARTKQTTGKVRFEIVPSSLPTESKLYRLDFAPTYIPHSAEFLSYDESGSVVLEDVQITDMGGYGQATAILRAGERFLGTSEDEENKFYVTVCIQDGDACSELVTAFPIRERRAPVVLIHGLWGSASSWVRDPWLSENDISGDEGMKPELKRKHFRVTTFGYDNSKGPRVTMQPGETGLYDTILGQCRAENREGFACTRNDIVGHSMGGLVARKYIKDNEKYKDSTSYYQGNVRRLITLGTPHFGSGLANLLTFQDGPIGNCIFPLLGHKEVTEIILLLFALGYDFDALDDLAIGSSFLRELNAQTQQVATFAVIGDIGKWVLTNKSLLKKLVEKEILETGCSHADLFSGDNSDGVVSVRSARGGVDDSHSNVLKDVPHLGMGKNEDVVRETIRRLNAPLKEFSPNIPSQGNRSALLKSPVGRKGLAGIKSSSGKVLSVLGVLGVTAVQAAGMPAVELSVEPQNPAPGETIVFSAVMTGGGVETAILTDGWSYELVDDTPPYSWTIDLSKRASGERVFKVVSIIDGQVVESNIVTVTVRPDLASLRQLVFEPGDSMVLFPGRSEQLRVLGLFKDGYKRDLTQALMGTTYGENVVAGVDVNPGDSPAITISKDGKVTGLQPGKAEIVVTNSGKTAVRLVEVIAVEKGDADGDGLSDAVEERIGTDKYNPDTDGDGVTDLIEVGPEPNSPLDLNGDGRHDALGANVVTFRDATGGYMSIETSVGTLDSHHARKLDDYPERPAELAKIDMARGMVGFLIKDLSPGQRVDVTLSYDSLPSGVTGYLIYGERSPESDEAQWYLLDNVSIKGNRVVIQLTDNQPGDSSVLEGVVKVVGGIGADPSRRPTSTGGSSSGGGGGGCAYRAEAKFDPMLPLLLLLSCCYLWRARSRRLGGGT